MTALLETISTLSTTIIVVLGAMHVAFFIILWQWYRRDLRKMAAALDDFTRGIQHRSILDRGSHLSDQVEAFLADVNEVLDNPARVEQRKIMLDRVNILDEKRRYLESLSFEISYSVCRTMIEAYPLMGILGTIIAIGAALQTGHAPQATGNEVTVGVIVQRFGEAIWSTCAGLVGALLLMFFNSLVETPFLRLTENRQHVRNMIAKLKGALIAGGSSP